MIYETSNPYPLYLIPHGWFQKREKVFYLTFVRVEVAVNLNCIGKRYRTGFVIQIGHCMVKQHHMASAYLETGDYYSISILMMNVKRKN